LAIGLVTLGATGGWFAHERLRTEEPAAVAPVELTIDRPIAVPEGIVEADRTAPGVVGLTVDRARQVLFDAGIPDADVTVSVVPQAGEPDVVVSQEPPPGQAVEGTVELSVSEAAVVPDIVGQELAAGRQAIEDLGALVVVSRRYDPGAAEGTILGVQPGAGEILGPEVAMTVAAAPSSVFLAALDPIESNCSPSDETVNATSYPTSLACQVYTGSADIASYVLNRRVSRLEAVIGQADRSDPNVTVRYVAQGDGSVLLDEVVSFGEGRAIALDLSGVLRLDLSAVVMGEEGPQETVTAVWGSARLVGAPDDVDILVAGP
jgi:hypothetical protein